MQEGRVTGQRATTADFVARPRLLNRPGAMAGGQGMFRDTYREFMKVVPQNIMHDRRVVRGNTFAALVIPISKSLYLAENFRYATRCTGAELVVESKTTQDNLSLRRECKQHELSKFSLILWHLRTPEAVTKADPDLADTHQKVVLANQTMHKIITFTMSLATMKTW